MSEQKYDREVILDYLVEKGPSTSRQIGIDLFDMPKRWASARIFHVLRSMERAMLIRRKVFGRSWFIWEATGKRVGYADKQRCEPIELFKKAHASNTKNCYQGSNGFVHVFDSGACVCNCGKRVGRTTEGCYVGHSRLRKRRKIVNRPKPY